MSTPTAVLAGFLLPESILTSEAFSVWASFVALNTLLYVALSIAKILPKWHPTDWWYHVRGVNRRTETRSIYPDAPV